MTNDETRDCETPDRPDASIPTARACADCSIRQRLAAIDRLARSLLADVQATNEAPLEDLEPETRRAATRRLREVRAEAERVELELFGSPLASPADDPAPATVVGCGSLATAYRGPDPGAGDDVLESVPDDEGVDPDRRHG
ncbi:hypothetical protein NP511_00405 [Natrinema thermotolerans]|uniref:Uncharacterized protein n=1 Tax=Natrinema thermotolerans TaxID=121872 RepID=A0AAF0PAF1_9EURY|nr:hypothetical protein [Natrinema thermotolerans]WMT07480.1 hypothetical protein NP511_19120 [Natrinema thermotolerans]WMT08112.1 hypothetical protein NP511_00405 [Natrinema thermotolerans]